MTGRERCDHDLTSARRVGETTKRRTVRVIASFCLAGGALLADNWFGAARINCSGGPTSIGHNLEDADACGLSASSDMTNTNPKLDTLTAMNDTLVHPLKPGSPPIDAGLCVVGVNSDQRGVWPVRRDCSATSAPTRD
jgi:hypothetical protein